MTGLQVTALHKRLKRVRQFALFKHMKLLNRDCAGEDSERPHDTQVAFLAAYASWISHKNRARVLDSLAI